MTRKEFRKLLDKYIEIRAQEGWAWTGEGYIATRSYLSRPALWQGQWKLDVFKTDEEAIAFIQRRADEGSIPHQEMLTAMALCKLGALESEP